MTHVEANSSFDLTYKLIKKYEKYYIQQLPPRTRREYEKMRHAIFKGSVIRELLKKYDEFYLREKDRSATKQFHRTAANIFSNANLKIVCDFVKTSCLEDKKLELRFFYLAYKDDIDFFKIFNQEVLGFKERLKEFAYTDFNLQRVKEQTIQIPFEVEEQFLRIYSVVDMPENSIIKLSQAEIEEQKRQDEEAEALMLQVPSGSINTTEEDDQLQSQSTLHLMTQGSSLDLDKADSVVGRIKKEEVK